MDYLIRAIASEGKVRALAAVTTDMVEEARRRHNTSPTASAALGRLLTAGALLSATLVDNDKLTIRVLGSGPAGAIVVNADSRGRIRGYIQNPHADIPGKYPGKLDVGGLVGKNGMLFITRDIGLKEPYTGSVPLISGEIGEDLAAYFVTSEQLPTVVALGVLVEKDITVRAAGGYLVQLMPGHGEEEISIVENNINKIAPVSDLIDRGNKPEDIIKEVLHGFDITILDKKPLEWNCGCSRDRTEELIISLGEKEIKSIIDEQSGAELVCHFCNEKYYFTAEELKKILEKVQK